MADQFTNLLTTIDALRVDNERLGKLLDAIKVDWKIALDEASQARAKNARLQAIVGVVAGAFEPEMDKQLACDERAAVSLCREAAEAAEAAKGNAK